jgi:hypothetical protein
MCDHCEEAARQSIEEAIKLLGHDASLVHPALRDEIESREIDETDLDSFFIQAAISRLAIALAQREHKPPFIVLGEIAGAMMTAQKEAEETAEFIRIAGISLN